MGKKTARLRQLLTSDQLSFLCEAHNGISAKIVEEAGFRGLWASGLTLSASLGVRDNNEASWTQVLDIVEFMADATSIPILLDGDTGYGDFNNFRRLVTKLEQREIAGVCIEDKLFPKSNSFLEGGKQELADIDEFCGKIKAGKDTQTDDEFSIVARTEALIAGWSMEEALKRAEAYRQAGADAILIHSKKSKPREIEAFMKEWQNRHPVVIVPTTYYSTPTERFRELGINTIIWANQILRAAILAMQETAKELRATQQLTSTEDTVASLLEVFRLQGTSELQCAESIYMGNQKEPTNAIILAASRGEQLSELTEDKPKTMLSVHGQPILFSLADELSKRGVKDVTVVRGYKKETIPADRFNVVDNDEHETTGELWSLYQAVDELKGRGFILYGDCLYRNHLLSDAISRKHDITLVVDATPRPDMRHQDAVQCTKEYSNDFFNQNICLANISAKNNTDFKIDGEWTGIMFLSAVGADRVKTTLEHMKELPDFKTLSMNDLLLHLLKSKQEIAVVYTKGGWLNINDVKDFSKAGSF